MRARLAGLVLRVAGWSPEGPRPASPKFVLIAAPHTSNWDLLYFLALAEVYGIRVSWMGKHQLFRGPMGWLMRALGGVPVRRDRRNDMVRQMADLVRRSDRIALAVPVEGTRGYVPYWKSGFYRIALAADVPLVMGFLDFARRRGGFGPEFVPTGNVRVDMDRVRDFYADKTPKYPACFGPVRLREEAAVEEAPAPASAAPAAIDR